MKPWAITRLLPVFPENRARVLIAQRTVRTVSEKPLAERTSLDMARYRNAKRILDRWNNEGHI